MITWAPAARSSSPRVGVSAQPIEEISRLVGHSGTTVTELVYRHQLRPVIQTGAVVMDRLFAGGGSHSVGHSPDDPDNPADQDGQRDSQPGQV
ncbi:hypothetical protein [Enemella evansiae]|uniref:hypothetical protein n=1 Tax=Enemella evansiae TaxID=2016499 RepID=UPI001E3BC516|nr:hypothetical protein [Enemella evansiae]